MKKTNKLGYCLAVGCAISTISIMGCQSVQMRLDLQDAKHIFTGTTIGHSVTVHRDASTSGEAGVSQDSSTYTLTVNIPEKYVIFNISGGEYKYYMINGLSLSDLNKAQSSKHWAWFNPEPGAVLHPLFNFSPKIMGGEVLLGDPQSRNAKYTVIFDDTDNTAQLYRWYISYYSYDAQYKSWRPNYSKEFVVELTKKK